MQRMLRWLQFYWPFVMVIGVCLFVVIVLLQSFDATILTPSHCASPLC